MNHKTNNGIKTKIFILIGISICILMSIFVGVPRSQPPAQVAGIFWQPDLLTVPSGNWNLLGVTTFVPQFGIVDGKSWLPANQLQQWEPLPNWKKTQQQPWAEHLILGLSGEYSEINARAHVLEHGIASKQFIQQVHLDKAPQGYYFPIEADPTWLRVNELGKALQMLPSPLWVSIYSSEAEPEFYDVWLNSWLPPNTSVFFQDGVGTGVRTPKQALKIVQQLQHRFGAKRIVIVLEAFRPKKGGGFRSAYPWEMIQQLKTYEGQTVYIFDGPHYVSRTTVYAVALWQKLAY